MSLPPSSWRARFAALHQSNDVPLMRDLIFGPEHDKPPPEAVAAIIHELDLNTEFHDTPFTACCRADHPEMLSLFIEYLRSVARLSTTIDTAIKEGRTALFVAAADGNQQCVELLTEGCADVDRARTSDGMTPLSIACARGHVEVAKFLVANGATVDQADTDGVTPLAFACNKGHVEVAKFLVANGATVDKADTNGVTDRKSGV